MPVLNRMFSEGFRVFFLAAGLYGLFAGLVWTLFIAGLGDGPIAGPPPAMWHAHEMIFGYATAAIGGFFLTAVPNWTGAAGVGPRFIALTAGLWCAGRLAIWYAALMPPVWVAAIDLAFLPVLAMGILTQLVQRPKPQNVVFLLFLAYLLSANLLVHLEWSGVTEDTSGRGLRGGLATLCALISILGGRVTPAFTRNAMKREGVAEARWPVSHPLTERAALFLAVALPPLTLVGISGPLAGPVEILFGLITLIRLSRWGGIWCLDKPILLALHVGLAMLGVGMILWGLAGLGAGRELAGLHVLGIGCVGGMTLAVMSRAALGHSGRALKASGTMALSYGLMALSAIARWVGAGSADLYLAAMLITGALWVTALALFLVAMWPALLGLRMEAAE